MVAVDNIQLSWHIEVLGNVRVICTQAAEPSSEPEIFENFGKPAQALLAYLAQHLDSKTALPRAAIAEEFRQPPHFAEEEKGWSKETDPNSVEGTRGEGAVQHAKSRKGRSEAQKSNDRFRQVLSDISKKLALGEDTARKESLFTGGTGTLGLNRASVSSDITAFAEARLDAEAFDVQVANALLTSEALSECKAHLIKAKKLYRGDFLPDFSEVWIKTKRARLAEDYLDVLARLARASLQGNEQSQAQQYLDEYFEKKDTLARKYGVSCRKDTQSIVDSLHGRLSFHIARSESGGQHGSLRSAHFSDDINSFPSLIRGQIVRRTQDQHIQRLGTHFVGRDEDVEKVLELLPPLDRDRLITSVARQQLVTVWGPLGCGKTRLAMECAGRVRKTYNNAGGSIIYCSLATASYERSVTGAIAAAVAEALKKTWSESSPVEFLKVRLSQKPVLLLLDDADYLTSDGCLELSDLLGQMRNMCCMVIAKQPLELFGEQYGVSPLELPSPNDPLIKMRNNPSIRLLLDWANTMAGPHRNLVLEKQGPLIAELCMHIGGNPLALQVIASWLPDVSVEDMLHRIGTSSAKQQGWPVTWQLVSSLADPGWLQFLKQVAVLPSPCAIKDVQSILPRVPVTEYVAGLAKHGLLKQIPLISHDSVNEVAEQALPGDVPKWFALPTAVRDLLMTNHPPQASRADQDDLRAAHAAYFAGRAAHLRRQMQGPRQASALDALEEEVPHLYAALGWCLKDKRDIPLGLHMAGNLWEFWEQRTHWKKGIEWLALARKEGNKTADHIALANVCNGLAAISMNSHRQVDAEKYAADAWKHALKGRHDPAGKPITARTLIIRAYIARRKAEYKQANKWYGKALKILMEVSSVNSAPLGPEALLLYHGLGSIAGELSKDWAAAAEFYEDALNVGLVHQDRANMSHVLMSLANASGWQGNHAMPVIYLELCYRFRRELRQWGGLAACLEHLGYWSARRGEAERAHYLYGAARRLREDYDVVHHNDQPESKQDYLARNRKDIHDAPSHAGFRSVPDEQTEQLDWWFEQGYGALSNQEGLVDRALDGILDWPPAGLVQTTKLA